MNAATPRPLVGSAVEQPTARLVQRSSRFLGVTENAELADPLLVLERGEAPARPLPAFFAFASTRDPVLDDTRRVERALAALHVPHEVRYYAGVVARISRADDAKSCATLLARQTLVSRTSARP